RRAARVPFGTMQLKMQWPEEEGFKYHRFNDWPGRIDAAQAAGYEHVRDKNGALVKWTVGTADGGGPLTAYLMMIPDEWAAEDHAAHMAEVAKREEGIKRNIAPQQIDGGTQQDVGKFYAGKEGSSIKRE